MIAPLFADNTATVEVVFMRNRVVIGLTCPYSFIIVSERIGIHTYTCISQSAAIFPSEVETVVIAFGISDGIVGDNGCPSPLNSYEFKGLFYHRVPIATRGGARGEFVSAYSI